MYRTTLQKLLRWRHENGWLNMRVVPGVHRGRWDVVMRIDGGYADRADAERMAEFWTEEFLAVLNDKTAVGK